MKLFATLAVATCMVAGAYVTFTEDPSVLAEIESSRAVTNLAARFGLQLSSPWLTPPAAQTVMGRHMSWPSAAVRRVIDLKTVIQTAAKKHHVPPAFVKSIIAAESAFDPEAVSPKGAIGLMQLMPETAAEYGADPTDPVQNVDAGTRYLRVLMTRYEHSRNGIKRTIAAYNAGPGMVDKYRGIPPFRETRTYVARVLSYYRQFSNGRS